MDRREDRVMGTLIGLACGDAVGTTVEFRARGSFKPLTDMVGGGPFNLKVGEWTDDTSMAFALATSLVNLHTFNEYDVMDQFVDWYRKGMYSSNGRCFDIGNTTASSLTEYQITRIPFAANDDPRSAGNGSIMRLAPVAMMCKSYRKAEQFAVLQSATTHRAREAMDCCRVLAHVLLNAYEAESVADVVDLSENEFVVPVTRFSPAIQDIVNGGYIGQSEATIHSSGYSVHTLEAAMWAFYRTDNFRDCILEAVNLGDDADTVGAVAGQIAGAYYGLSGIPTEWINKLARKDELLNVSEELYHMSKVDFS